MPVSEKPSEARSSCGVSRPFYREAPAPMSWLLGNQFDKGGDERAVWVSSTPGMWSARPVEMDQGARTTERYIEALPET